MQAPVAKKIPKSLKMHNDERTDNYFWLNDREDQEVIAYLNSENEFTQKTLEHTQTLQDTVYEEIVGRIKKDDESVPYKLRGYMYYTRFVEGGEYPIYCRREGSMQSKEEVLLDVNVLAQEHAYYKASGLSVSSNNQLMAYGEDTVSRRIYKLRVKDLETNELLDVNIEGTSGSYAWANDNETLFYTLRDEETLRSYKVMSFNIRTGETKEHFEEDDDTFYTGVYKSKSEQYLIIFSGSTLTTEYRVLSADQIDAPFEVFQPRIREMEYSISHFEDQWYILTNWDAKNFRLMTTPVGETNREAWTEVIAHREDTLLEGIEVFKDFMVVEEKTAGQNQLRVKNLHADTEYYMEFESETYDVWSSTNVDFDTSILRFGYTSMTTPSSIFDFDMVTKEKSLLKQQEVVGGYNENLYESKRLWATARDGKKVPMSVVYRKDVLGKTNPLLLYAYGSYGHSIDPYFSSSRLSLLDRGFVYVIAHIRGGEDLGRWWYEEGKLLKKKNTFTDYIDCAEYLIAEGYTTKEQLFAMGGSAGGLLMGAVVNMRPDLWKGVIAAVPFVDVVTTMLDETIPLTTGEYDEWGNPNEVEYYHYIKSYSPYDNIEAKDYPNMLVTTGLHDSQVQYWEPAKWVAKLRELKTDNNTLLLHCNMETGHGGASGRFSVHKETAMEYAFLLWLAGIQK